jgi:hypothetical protein
MWCCTCLPWVLLDPREGLPLPQQGHLQPWGRRAGICSGPWVGTGVGPSSSTHSHPPPPPQFYKAGIQVPVPSRSSNRLRSQLGSWEPGQRSSPWRRGLHIELEVCHPCERGKRDRKGHGSPGRHPICLPGITCVQRSQIV